MSPSCFLSLQFLSTFSSRFCPGRGREGRVREGLLEALSLLYVRSSVIAAVKCHPLRVYNGLAHIGGEVHFSKPIPLSDLFFPRGKKMKDRGWKTKIMKQLKKSSCCCWVLNNQTNKNRQLLTVDVSVLTRMKNAAKCDTWCESQEPVSHRVFERTSRPWYSWGHACPSAAAQPKDPKDVVEKRCFPWPSFG